MSTYLVTGASRGCGLALSTLLANDSSSLVSTLFVTTRSSPPQELAALVSASQASSSKPKVIHVPLDLHSTESIKAAAEAVASHLGATRALNYLICNAGARDEPTPKIEDMDVEDLRSALETNVIGTYSVVAAFLPLMKRFGPGAVGPIQADAEVRKIVLFSSTLGCATVAQTDKRLQAPYPAYRISKAGTHMLAALWANRLRDEGKGAEANEEGRPKFCVTLQSPGNLKTDLAGKERADLQPEVGAAEIIRIAREARPEDSGRHRNIFVEGWDYERGIAGPYDGKDLFW